MKKVLACNTSEIQLLESGEKNLDSIFEPRDAASDLLEIMDAARSEDDPV